MASAAELAHALADAFPRARIVVDPSHPMFVEANSATPVAHVDVRHDDRVIVIECHPTLGFGISVLLEPALDGGPNVRVRDVDAAVRQVGEMLGVVARRLEGRAP